MTSNEEARVKLTNTQLKKTQITAKYNTGTTTKKYLRKTKNI